MSKRAVLVLGPEASGTRLVTRILVAAGCNGEANHVQWFDWHPPNGATLIVWRRSLPHDNIWPDLGAMVRYLRLQDYLVSAVTTDRCDEPMIKAQERDHVKNEDVAKQHIIRAREICAGLTTPEGAALPVVHVQYEDLVAKPHKTMKRIVAPLGLNVPDIDIYDGNARYGAA